MANIISPICFSNANNDSTNDGSDFKVSACEKSAWICMFSFFFFPFFLKAQEIDVPLASAGRLATKSELHMFSLKMRLSWAELLSLAFYFPVWTLGLFKSSQVGKLCYCVSISGFAISNANCDVKEERQIPISILFEVI